MNVQDRQALHTYQRLVRQAEGHLGESNVEQNWSEATKACHRLLGLLELEENRNHKWNATAAAPTTSSSTIPGAVRRLKREVCSKLQATKDAGGRDQEERRTKLLSCSAFDVERREGTLPGAGRPLFHCPPSGTLSVDTLLASVRTPWLHAALTAPPPSTSTSTSTSTAPAPSSSSSSSSYTAAPAASSLRGKMPAPSSTSYPSSSTSSYSHAGGSSSSGGSAPSLARNNGDRPTGKPQAGAPPAGGGRRRQINYGRNRYNNRQDDSPDDDHLNDMEEDGQDDSKASKKEAFMSAREKLDKDDKQKGLSSRGSGSNSSSANGGSNAQPNARPSGLRGKRGFNPPFKGKDDKDDGRGPAKKQRRGDDDDGDERKPNTENNPLLEELLANEKLKFIDPIMVERICSEILDHSPAVGWDDIAGLAFAKKCVKEAVVLPLLRPDFFRGIRTPPKGILLFGPPGTGKTMIGKAIASQSGARFFAISASSLTSKWIGEGEKTVRALFAVARCLQPAVIFIDEIDSILTQRSENDQEATRRLKTEFLIQLDGAACSGEDKLLVVGATNRPAEIDEAARRRLVKRLYIPLPDTLARRSMILHYLHSLQTDLTDDHVDTVVARAQGYSGSDIKALCAEAAMGPIRNLEPELLMNLSEDQIRPIGYDDFVSAFDHVRPSVSQKDLASLQEWNEQYGSFKTTGEEALIAETDV